MSNEREPRTKNNLRSTFPKREEGEREFKKHLEAKALNFDRETAVEIKANLPFHFEATVYNPSHFSTPTEACQSSKFWQAVLECSLLAALKEAKWLVGQVNKGLELLI